MAIELFSDDIEDQVYQMSLPDGVDADDLAKKVEKYIEDNNVLSSDFLNAYWREIDRLIDEVLDGVLEEGDV